MTVRTSAHPADSSQRHGVQATLYALISFALMVTALVIGAAPAQAEPIAEPITAEAAAVWSNWSEVPGQGLTPDAPNTVNYRGEQYVFVRGTDNRIYRNINDTGSWTGWAEIPGGGLTYSAPNAAVYNNQLYVFVQGTDNRIYRNRLNTNGSWTGWAEIPGGGLTPSAPGPGVYKGDLSVFVRGTDNRIYVNVLTP